MPDEVTSCVQACAFVRLPAPMPDYFQEFVAQIVETSRPELAGKVRGLNVEQVNELYHNVRNAQSLLS